VGGTASSAVGNAVVSAVGAPDPSHAAILTQAQPFLTQIQSNLTTAQATVPPIAGSHGSASARPPASSYTPASTHATSAGQAPLSTGVQAPLSTGVQAPFYTGVQAPLRTGTRIAANTSTAIPPQRPLLPSSSATPSLATGRAPGPPPLRVRDTVALDSDDDSQLSLEAFVEAEMGLVEESLNRSRRPHVVYTSGSGKHTQAGTGYTQPGSQVGTGRAPVAPSGGFSADQVHSGFAATRHACTP